MLSIVGNEAGGGVNFQQNTKLHLTLAGVGVAFIAIGITSLCLSNNVGVSTLGGLFVTIGTVPLMTAIMMAIYKCYSGNGSTEREPEPKGAKHSNQGKPAGKVPTEEEQEPIRKARLAAIEKEKERLAAIEKEKNNQGKSDSK